jgi:predicted O-linked N-acetylglucosamine transferase (SPINDLY family)
LKDRLQHGIALHRAGNLVEAEKIYREVLKRNPNHSDALQLLGTIAHQQGQHGIAVGLIQRSLALEPGAKTPLNNLGEALRATGQIDQSIAAFEQALELGPLYVKTHSNLVATLHYAETSTGKSLLREHQRWAWRYADKFVEQPHPNDRSPDRPLRIGYVSPDFRRHSVGYFIEPILQQHRKDQFRVYCYYNYGEGDEVTQRLRGFADEWREIADLSDDKVAETVRGDGIDILVDLGGHMAKNRLLLFARKPAPVQVTYLGYPNGTGIPQMDYRISDAVSDPPGMTDDHYVEKLVRLQTVGWCYRPPEASPEVAERPASAAVTFGSFNKFPKLSPSTMKAWGQIVSATPGSRLVVKAKSLCDEVTREIARQMFAESGVPRDRLTLSGWEGNLAEHLRMYHDIDVALDPFPYNGTTTTCEALWMGVPVIALSGRTHVSRVGRSLLTAVGLDSLVADAHDDYVAIAVGLAGDEARRRELRRTMRERMQTSPLMDSARFTADLEAAYRQIWRQWCAA